MQRILLFLKGACMGASDIIPGVSGGTMALILGIYDELVHTLRGVHLRWLPAVWQWVSGGFDPEDGREVLEAWESMNLTFLVILGLGLFTAVGVGGMVLPELLERYPEAMRALFFGLIVASLWIPLDMIEDWDHKTRWAMAVMLVIGIVAGWYATNPDRMHDMGTSWTQVESQGGETLGDVTRRGPSASPGAELFWAEENAPLREAVQDQTAGMELDDADDEIVDPELLKERSEQYYQLELPEGTPVQLPQPAVWFVFLAGAIAICGMILPGISGAYILLILGAYFFALNALRAVLTGAAQFSVPETAMFYVVVFLTGCVVGLFSFAKVMSYLLREFRTPTVGLLVGLMIGCLRGIWPFQQVVDGKLVNVMPEQFGPTVLSAIVAALAGVAAVATLTWLGRNVIEDAEDPAEIPGVVGNTGEADH